MLEFSAFSAILFSSTAEFSAFSWIFAKFSTSSKFVFSVVSVVCVSSMLEFSAVSVCKFSFSFGISMLSSFIGSFRGCKKVALASSSSLNVLVLAEFSA